MPTELTYPHTSIQADLQTLSVRLADSEPELAQLANQVLQQYLAKKLYYTARISELEEGSENGAPFGMTGDRIEDSPVRQLPDYPHTSILDTLYRLRRLVFNGNSETKQEEMELLQSLDTEYSVKKAFLFKTIEQLLNK